MFWFQRTDILFELEDIDESRQFEYVLDVVVYMAQGHLAACSLGSNYVLVGLAPVRLPLFQRHVEILLLGMVEDFSKLHRHKTCSGFQPHLATKIKRNEKFHNIKLCLFSPFNIFKGEGKGNLSPKICIKSVKKGVNKLIK